jgi:hypothetical protein
MMVGVGVLYLLVLISGCVQLPLEEKIEGYKEFRVKIGQGHDLSWYWNLSEFLRKSNEKGVAGHYVEMY